MTSERPKIYIETTLFNFYFDEKMGEDHKATLRLFEMIAEGRYIPYTSSYAIEELENAPPEKRNKMTELIKQYDITVIYSNDVIEKMADIYISEGMISEKKRTDSLHMAAAAVNGLDMIITMNLRDICKLKTKQMIGRINKQQGYRNVAICSPREVVENERYQHRR